MRHSIDMAGVTVAPFIPNYRHPGQNYSATIQNNTVQSLTVTVSNQNIVGEGIAGKSFVAPAAGALVIAAGAMGVVSAPYAGWRLTLAGAGIAGETIDIVEVG